jgi:diguanylate cyclase (GGDEF)-like protein/PAS domain S-box-containing protein
VPNAGTPPLKPGLAGVDFDGLLARATELLPDGASGPDELSLYRTLLEAVPALVYVDPVEEDANSLYVSPQVTNLLGITQEEWVTDQSCWGRHVHPEDFDGAWAEYVDAIRTGEPLHREYRMLHKDGEVRWVVERAVQVRRPDGSPWLFLGAIVDVTSQRDSQEVAFLAYHDKLTGLPNRALFEEMLSLEIGRARRAETAVGLLFIDLDNFKQVNDTMGHQAGDLLLAGFAERLKPCLREADVFARRSGDEFLILLNDLEGGPGARAAAEAVASLVAERIAEALVEPFDLHGVSYTASASVGVAFFPLDADDVPTLLKRADEAMYRSKRIRPGGHVFWNEHRDEPIFDETPAVERLRRAAAQRSWVLHWQPIVDLADGAIRGVEALLRWKDDAGGLIAPGEFLPLAEEMGLIESIGQWTVNELCRQDEEWRAAGVTLNLGLNLSPRQLWSPRLTESILGPLRAAGIGTERVTIDVSEAALMADPDRAQKVLHELWAWGLNVAIDDFGSGGASLSRLALVPAHTLKIDRGLVRGIDGDADQAGMVRAIVGMADGLKMTTHAVGVETPTEAEVLRRLGCRLAQGFLFGRPLPAVQIPELVRESIRAAAPVAARPVKGRSGRLV